MRYLITVALALSVSCASSCATVGYQGEAPEHGAESAPSADAGALPEAPSADE